MRVYLYELSETPKELRFTEKDAWLAESVRDTQETETGAVPNYKVDFEMRKLQEIVDMKGHVVLDMGLLCSRCANGFTYHLDTRFETMFTRETALSRTDSNKGVAYSEPTGASPTDLDIELLEKDYIELGDVLKEQIYLRLPFQPLCREDCKGICPVCGQDKNTQPCQCHRIKTGALANALRNLKT